MRNWISEYRLTPLELEKENKEIFKLIETHQNNVDKIVENRNVKISTILDEDFVDPLIYLNSIIDALKNTIKKSMNAPSCVIYFISSNEKEVSVISPKSKFIQASTMYFNTIEEFSENILDTEYDVFPYLITEENGKIKFRGAKVKKDSSIKWI